MTTAARSGRARDGSTRPNARPRGTGPPPRGGQADATHQRILEAATDVFAARGFTAATMADVVARSGVSVGTIYHHFGGKKELFLAIFEQLAAEVDRAVRKVVTPARSQAGSQAGEVDRRRAFELTARAYLDATWANRHAAQVLASGDSPAGFEAVRRNSMLDGFRRWMAVLELDSSPRGRLLTRVLIAALHEASVMLITSDGDAEVGPITDATVDWIGRLTS